MSAIADNLALLNGRIVAAAERSGRRWEEITLVAVTKRQPASAVLEALVAGISEVGENYVQEAADKQSLVWPAQTIAAQWHLIGHLQTNKTKQAVALFDLIQSVDSVRLARTIGSHTEAIGKVQNILLQVQLGDEETKTGLPLDQAPVAIAEISALPSIALCGLMGIAPFEGDPRPYFKKLRQLFETIPTENRHILSMGMSGDFETAIEEGATMIRVGTAIFGPRA